MQINVDERCAGIYTATLKDSAGAAIALASLTTLTLTLYDVATGTIINSRSAQNVKNANNVTYHATSGLLTWSVQQADHPIVTTTTTKEHHTALFGWTTSTEGGYHEVEFIVRNLSNVP